VRQTASKIILFIAFQRTHANATARAAVRTAIGGQSPPASQTASRRPIPLLVPSNTRHTFAELRCSRADAIDATTSGVRLSAPGKVASTQSEPEAPSLRGERVDEHTTQRRSVISTRSIRTDRTCANICIQFQSAS
jgi:hypothetical protein